MTAIATAPSAAHVRSFREVWLITIGHGLTHWYPATFYLLLPLIGKELGLSYSQIGLVMTSQYIAGALSNIPGGMLVDAVGRKGFLLALSLFWIGFPYALMGVTHSYLALLVCISLVGIGNNLWHPAAIPTLAYRFPERKGLVLSLHGMGGNMGDALAPLAIGALLVAFTWREVVFMNVVPGVIIACLILVFLGTMGFAGKSDADARESAVAGRERRSASEYLRGLRELLNNRSLVTLVMSSSFRTMTQATLLTFLPVFLAYDLGYSPFWVGACMFALQAAGFVASPIAGHVSDRMGRRRILISSMAMTAVVLIGMAFAGRSQVFIFFIAALGFFLYAIRPVLQAWLLESTPKGMGGTSIGILFGAQALGAAIGPAVGGLIADKYGLMATFYFLAATIVVANLFIFRMPAQTGRVHGTTNDVL
jgi:MFS family permease